MTTERHSSSLDDEEPGSQGEIEAGSEGDFAHPASEDTPEVDDTPDSATEDATGDPPTA
jgi:hypothetical protein